MPNNNKVNFNSIFHRKEHCSLFLTAENEEDVEKIIKLNFSSIFDRKERCSLSLTGEYEEDVEKREEEGGGDLTQQLAHCASGLCLQNKPMSPCFQTLPAK